MGIIGRATLRQLRRQLDLEEASLDDRTSAGPPHRTRKAGVACGCPPRVEGCDADADDRCVQAARTREYRLLSTAARKFLGVVMRGRVGVGGLWVARRSSRSLRLSWCTSS